MRLDELVRDIGGRFDRSKPTARGCELKLRRAARCWIEGEPELLRRAVENVIRNAIRYAPAGTAVEVSVARNNGKSGRVRDYGPGVPEEALAAHLRSLLSRGERPQPVERRRRVGARHRPAGRRAAQGQHLRAEHESGFAGGNAAV